MPNPALPPPYTAVQVGRAGRDGAEARCVALLDDGDFTKLRSLAYRSVCGWGGCGRGFGWRGWREDCMWRAHPSSVCAVNPLTLLCSGVLDLPAVHRFLEAVFSPAAEGERVPRGRKPGSKAGGKAAASKAAGGRATGGKRGRKRKVDSEEDVEGEQAPGAEEQGEEQQAGGEPSAGGDAPLAERRRRFGVLALRKLAAELDMREERCVQCALLCCATPELGAGRGGSKQMGCTCWPACMVRVARKRRVVGLVQANMSAAKAVTRSSARLRCP